ncbi:MAG: LptF/LptG family permease [Bacteroidota bacterium]
MKILDRYLVKQFLQTVLFGVIAFALIFVIIDMMEHLDEFIDEDVPGNIIIQYYFAFIPEIIRLMIPVAVLLSGLFVAGKMSNLNELTAIKSCGVSLYRFMTPFILTALFISIISVYFGGYVVPLANKHKVNIERLYMRKDVIHSGMNIVFQDSQTRIVTIASYNVGSNQAHRVSIQDFDKNDLTKMIERFDAERMKYDTLENIWVMYKIVQREFTDESEVSNSFSEYKFPDLNFSPGEVVSKQRKNEEMSLSELSDFADSQIRSGNDPTRVLIEYHSRFAFAFASVITVLFGLPISANKRRGGLAVQFGINLLITFFYLVFMKISQAFGKNGVLNPFLTAWFANFVFLAAAILNVIRARK